MRPDDADIAFVWDMHEAALRVIALIEGKRYSDYARDRGLQWSVERGVEVIGQAARLISQPFKDANPAVPWARIIAQRNVLAHEYKEVLVDRIWIVASEHIRELLPLLAPLIGVLPEESTDQ